LRQFAEKGDGSKLSVQNRGKVRMILNALNAATKPGDMDIPGFRFDPLDHDRKGEYSVWVTGNWRITFSWDEGDAFNVNLEDYH
jgi:toxin HigB-1